MSFSQQDPNGEHTRRLIPRSPSHPDLSQGLPPSTDSYASRSEFADTIDRETDPAILADQPNMPQYTSRDVGDPTQIKKNKQSMADLKLRRLTELNNRLREDLERERIPVSQASKRYERVQLPLSSDANCDCVVFLHHQHVLLTFVPHSIIAYCNSTRDYMVPSVWGVVPKGEDPYAPQQSGGCCTVM